jgi:hypothetical protein
MLARSATSSRCGSSAIMTAIPSGLRVDGIVHGALVAVAGLRRGAEVRS